MHSTRRPHRLALTSAAAVILAITASGCGAIVERATEEAVERAIESENGGDVDINFDENGIQIDGTDENGDGFSLDLDEGGFDARTENGESITIDEDGFTQTDENGEVTTGEFNTDGDNTEFVIEGEDGQAVFRTGTDIPNEWPGDTPRPEGLSDVNSSYQADGGSVFIIIGGQTSESSDDFADDYIAGLENAGFVQESIYADSSTRGGTFARDGENVALNVAEFDGTTTVAITYSLSE